MIIHISCGCKCKFNSTTCNSVRNWNNETCQCESKKYRTCKKNYSWNPSTCICEKSKHLKHIVDNSVIAFHETIYVIDIVSLRFYMFDTKITGTFEREPYRSKIYQQI